MLDVKQTRNCGNRIYEALNQPPLIWRTVDQVTEEAGVSREQVLHYLRNTDQHIVQSNYTNEFGEARFSTWTNYYANATIWQKLRGYLGMGVD